MTSIHKDIPFIASPNCSSRKGCGIDGTVIHYTAAGSSSGTVRWFANPQSRVSAHFVIGRSGRTVQMVPLDLAAWHAGVGEMVIDGEARSNPNRFTIGIELANHGFLHRDESGEFWWELGREMRPYRGDAPVEAALTYDTGLSVSGWWEPYPEPQIEALSWLLGGLENDGHSAAVKNLVGHEEISMPMGRKCDPGPVFPWRHYDRVTQRRSQGRSPIA